MNSSVWLRMDWQGVAYGLAYCLIHEIKGFGCVWIGKALRMDWHAA